MASEMEFEETKEPRVLRSRTVGRRVPPSRVAAKPAEDPLTEEPPAKKQKRQIAVESEDEDETAYEAPVNKTGKPQARGGPARKAGKPSKAEEEEDLDLSEMDVEKAPPAKSAPAKKGPAKKGPAKKAKIDFKTYGMTDMETYLKDNGLPVLGANKEPDPVFIGAVVWNINHLKGEGDTDTGARRKVKANKTKPQTYDTKKILTALTRLQGRLEDTDLVDELTIAALETHGQHAGPEYKNVRKEVSQFMRDIGEIRRLEPVDVVEIGTAALETSAARVGEHDMEVLSRQLEWSRALKKVWSRLQRLRLVLFSGDAEDTKSAAARSAIRKALNTDEDTAAGIQEDIKTLLTLIKPSVVNRTVNTLKVGAVRTAADDFFKKPEVNLAMFNEMNLGIDQLRSMAEDDNDLALSEGPVMLARGQPLQPNAKKRARVTTGSGNNTQGVSGKQFEYYPALYRTTGDNKLGSNGTFYVATNGKFIPQAGEENRAIPWNKAEEDFRGIVVHRLVQNGQEFWAGVLHTTPAGKDLDRRKIWPQLENALTALHKLAHTFKVPLLVGGDFYIPAEGIVTNVTIAQVEAMEAEHQDVVEAAKAWSFVRNLFLKAVQDNRLGELFGKLGLDDELPAESMEEEETTPARAQAANSPYQPAAGILKPHHTKLWETYKAAAVKQFERPDFGDIFDARAILQVFAPDMGFDNVRWNKTLAGGDITTLDIMRNFALPVADPLKGLTMQRVLRDIGYRVVEGGVATNPKEHGRGENKIQLADLFIANEYWTTVRSGIVTPGEAKARSFDTVSRAATNIYAKVSDHIPPLVFASTQPRDVRVYKAFDTDPEAREKAVRANLAAWDRLGERLQRMKSKYEPSLEEQVLRIKFLLSRPLVGPTNTVTRLNEHVTYLIASILGANDEGPELHDLVRDLRRWQHDPYYTPDVAD